MEKVKGPALIFLLILSLLSSYIEIDISIPSFPDISDYFGISDFLTQMIITVNFIGFCFSGVFYGPLSDGFGRYKVMIVGNFIMLLGALGCVYSETIEFLLISRFIQGVGASTSSIVAFAILADVYKQKDTTRLVGIINFVTTVFLSFAPIIGSFINHFLGWRWNYIVVALLSIISWVLLLFFLPETKKNLEKFSINKVFVNYKRLLTNKDFIYTSLIPSLSYAAYISFVACASFLYMEAYNLSIFYYAIHQGVLVASFSFFSLMCGKIINIVGEKKSVKYGNVILLSGALIMLIVSLTLDGNNTVTPYLTTFSMVVYGIGAAVTYPVVFVKSLDVIPEIRGTASSANLSIRSFVGAISVAISSYLYNGSLFYIAVVVTLITIIHLFMVFNLFNFMKFE